jgi:hypothetical protein
MSSNPTFEGEGDTFPRERVKETHASRSFNITPKIAKVQSQCARVTFLGESVHTNISFGSSGSNIACEGLLLGTWREDRKEPPVKLHPTHPTFANITSVSTFGVCFAERDSTAQRRRASNLHQHHDHQHLQRLFCRKEQPRPLNCEA